MNKILFIFGILLSTQLYAKNSCDVVFQDDSGEVYKNTEECNIIKSKDIVRFILNDSPALWLGRDKEVIIKSKGKVFNIYSVDLESKKSYKIDSSFKAVDELTGKTCYIFDNFTYQFCYN